MQKLPLTATSLGLLVACASSGPSYFCPEVPPSPPSRIFATQVAAASASAKPMAPCDRLHAERVPPLLAVPPGAEARAEDAKRRVELLLRELPPCISFGAGVWAVVPKEATLTSAHPAPAWDHLVQLKLTAVLELPNGRRFEKDGLVVASNPSLSKSVALRTFDYDGDGMPELLITTRTKEQNAPEAATGEVLTYAKDRIVPYAAATKFTIVGFDDIDHDGRPDLDLGRLYEGAMLPQCTSTNTYVEVGPRLFAHSLASGEFSVTDDVATSVLRKACPRAPRTLVPRVHGGIDNDALRENIVCALAWGVSAHSLRVSLHRDCPPTSESARSCRFKGVLPDCVNVELLESWTNTRLPVQLAAPAAD